MSANRAGRRGRRTYEGRPVRKRFLIVCEGEKTEPNYFRAFPIAADVRVDVQGDGKNTVSLVESAAAYADAAAVDERPYDEVWVVYDQDCFGAQAFNAAAASVEHRGQVRTETWSAAWSNEAFEVWYLLHFQYFDGCLHRHLVAEKVADKLGGYAKNDPSMYRKLKERQPAAIRRARALEKEKGIAPHGNTTPADACSCTRVHHLVDALNAEIR